MKNSRQLALALARAANIQPEPERPSLLARIAEIKQRQTREGKGVRIKRAGEKAISVGSQAHVAYLRAVLCRSLANPPWDQVLELELLASD